VVWSVSDCEESQCQYLQLSQLENQKECYLKLFKCPPHVDPVAVAGIDEGEYLVEAIVAHRLEGTKKKNRTHYYFLVKFEDGEEEWIPYWEVRELGLYLRNHPDLARLLKFEVSWLGGGSVTSCTVYVLCSSVVPVRLVLVKLTSLQ
jgi:hypothetical protein